MADFERQVFPVARPALVMAKIGLGAFILVAVGAPVFLILDPNWKEDFLANIIAMVLFEAFFIGLIAYYAYTIWHATDYSITVDEDGLWYSTKGKEKGLVRWAEIKELKERQQAQRLELRGSEGQLLLRAEYQLARFHRLRDIIVKGLAGAREAVSIPVTIKGSMTAPVWMTVLGFLCLGLPVLGATDGRLLEGIGLAIALAAFSLWEYRKSLRRFRLLSDHLEIRYPFSTQTVEYSQIVSVQICDEVAKGNIFPLVRVFWEGAEPCDFRVGCTSIDLYLAITGALKSVGVKLKESVAESDST